MRIDAEHQSLIISESELTALATELKLPRNNLALIRAQQDIQQGGRVNKEFDGLPGWARDKYRQSIGVMSAPAQTAHINIVYPGQAVSRLALAWDRDDGNILTEVSRLGDEVSLRPITFQQARGLVMKTLDAGEVRPPAGIKLIMPAVTLVVFLAVIDYIQYDWYLSLLRHSQPAESFTLDEIWDRFQDAAAGDYRWPLPLFFSVFPADISGLLSEKELADSLQYLTETGLLISDGGDGAAIYTLSTEGKVIAGSFLESWKRIAIRISAPAGSGVGHEAVLFVRSQDTLWLFDLSGNKGAVSDLSADACSDIIQALFTTADKTQDASTISCPFCSKRISINDEFCTECGSRVKK